MQVRITLPPVLPSPLGRLDPRWRLVSLLGVLGAAAVVRTLPGTLSMFLGALLLARLAKMDWRWFLARLGVVGGVFALFVLPIPLLSSAGYAVGLRMAAITLGKALALFTLGAVLLVTSPLEGTCAAARALRVPGLLVQLVLMTYRYLFVLGSELARLRIALRVRAFSNRPNWHSYRTVACASGTLLVRGHDRAERVAAAMRCRGFDGIFRSLETFSTRRQDALAVVGILTLAGAIVALDRFIW